MVAMTTPTIWRHDTWIPDPVKARLAAYMPKSRLGLIVKACFAYLPSDLAGELLERVLSCVVVESSLALVHHHGPHSATPGRQDDLGIVGRKVVTDAGVAFIVDAFQNITELENFKYHGLGTGTTAEAAGQTALVTELTTEYTGNIRATGTTVEGATGNIFRTVATITLDSGTPVIREHGVFSASSAGTLLDRTLFAAVTLDGTAGDSLVATYEITFTSGS